MERTSNQTPVAIGIIVLILLAVFTFILVRDMYGFRTTVFGSDSSIKAPITNQNEANQQQADSPRVYTGFTLSDEQNAALVNAGVDSANIPDTITGDQEMCFVSTLGEERVAEIKGGALPSAIEFARAKSCIE